MAATNKVLGDLHAKVALALTEQVVGYDVVEDGVVTNVKPSPALLGAAIAFLKNNNITADVENNEALRELGDALAARRKKKLPQALLDDASNVYALSMGRM